MVVRWRWRSVSESPTPFDEIARIRAHIAWLGETGRFGWWQTDALSLDGGAAMLEGILPGTHRWAGLQIAWACAAAVETRLVDAPRAISLFRLGPVDARLQAWVRDQKRRRDPMPESMLPTGMEMKPTARDALQTWGLIRRSEHKPVAGGQSFRAGQVRTSALVTDDGVLDAVQRLAAGYEHSRISAPVVPYLELL